MNRERDLRSVTQYLEWVSNLCTPLADAPSSPHLQADPHDSEAHGARPPQPRINGVEMPEEVIRQIREALGIGTPLCWLTQDELREAVNSYRGDGRVFDDVNGEDFYDMLEISQQEALVASGCAPPERHDRYRILTVRPPDTASFCSRLRAEREQDNTESTEEQIEPALR
jgi:hypothetical protein